MFKSMSWRSVGVFALLATFGAVLSGCGGGGGDAWEIPTNFKTECTSPRLGVAYDIKYYKGEVTCGNLLLESDIGGTHPWIPPKITFPTATEGFYTLLYMDPYCNLAGEGSLMYKGSWTLGSHLTPGSKAVVRHWVAGNIDAAMLKSGDLTGATTVSKFKGPSPPWGSHPYVQFLFKQSGKLDFETLPSPEGIYAWDYKAFIAKHSLGNPVASNWHVTQHMDPRLPFNSSRPQPPIDPKLPVVPSFMKFTCSKNADQILGVDYEDILYYDGWVDCGNLLLESDIGGTHAWIPPKITLPKPEKNSLYTLMYIDPLCNPAFNGSWPNVLTPGSKTPVRHWVAGNIDATMLSTGDMTGATTVSKFKGPSPPWGSHRYGQFLFKQEKRIAFETLPSPVGIYNWDIQAFIDAHDLGLPVAWNWHVVQHMPPRPPAIAAATVVVV